MFYKSFLFEDFEWSFFGMRKILVEVDFLFFYFIVFGEVMEFFVENMYVFVIIENYLYYSFINVFFNMNLICFILLILYVFNR